MSTIDFNSDRRFLAFCERLKSTLEAMGYDQKYIAISINGEHLFGVYICDFVFNFRIDKNIPEMCATFQGVIDKTFTDNFYENAYWFILKYIVDSKL